MKRINIQLSGKAAEFMDKIKKHKRGLIISAVIADNINSGRIRTIVSPYFSKEETKEIFSSIPSNEIRQENITHIKQVEESVNQSTTQKDKRNVATIQNGEADSNDSQSFKVQI